MKKGRQKHTGKTFETRRAAFREAKRDHGVPVGKQPDEVVRPKTSMGKKYKLDRRNRRLYIFRILVSLFGFKDVDEEEIYIREDKEVIYTDGERQMEHFNAGKGNPKLKKHYYFKRR